MKKTLLIGCVVLAVIVMGVYGAIAIGLGYLFKKADTATAAIPSLTSHIVQNITYCSPDNQPQMLDLYVPDKPHTAFPLVVYVHGGSWVSGSKDEEAIARFLPTLADAGYVVASINYRLAPTYTFPAQIDDVKCAIRFLRAHADRYAVNPTRVGIIGESAGGYLAAFAGTTGDDDAFKTTAYTDKSDRVQAVVDISGPTDFTVDNASATAKRVAYTFLGTADRAAASPVTHVAANDPPFLILHGADDHVVPPSQSEHLQHALQAAGVESRLILVHNAGHDLDVSNVEPSFSQLALTILSFLKNHLQ